MKRGKKHLYIPIELKNRELDSQVLLAAKACSMGFRVYIGSHAAIYRALGSRKNCTGIYLDKGTQIAPLTKWIKAKCQYLFILDQELSPSVQLADYHHDKNLVSTRFYPGTKEMVDGFFCVGPVIYDQADSYFKSKKLIHDSGWPRIDLQKRYATSMYSDQIKNLKNQHGDFLLFVSDFGLLTPLSDIKSPTRRHNLLSSDPEEFWDESYQNFVTTVEVLREWDKNPDVPQIIIRPHIMDDLRVWKRVLRGTKKTKIIHKGDITPWVGASMGVIHRGSTVSIQAKLMNKKVFYLEEASTSHNRQIVKKISDCIVSIKQAPALSFSELNSEEDVNRVLKEVIFLHNEDASTRIVNVLEDLEVFKENPIPRLRFFLGYLNPKSIKRFAGLIRDEVIYLVKADSPAPQSKNIPFGLRKSDFRAGLSVDNAGSTIKTRIIGLNLWELDKRNH